VNGQVCFTDLERAELLRRLQADSDADEDDVGVAIDELAGLLSVEAELLALLEIRPTETQVQRAFADVAHAAGLLQRRLAVLIAMGEWAEVHLVVAGRHLYGDSSAAVGLLEGLAPLLKRIEAISDERERAIARRRKHATVPRTWLAPVAAICRAHGIRPAKASSSKFFAIASVCAAALTRANGLPMNVEWSVRTFA